MSRITTASNITSIPASAASSEHGVTLLQDASSRPRSRASTSANRTASTLLTVTMPRGKPNITVQNIRQSSGEMATTIRHGMFSIELWQRHRQSLQPSSSSFRRRQHAPSDQFRSTPWRSGPRRHSRWAADSVIRGTTSPQRNVRSKSARRRSIVHTIARQRYNSCLVVCTAFPRIGGHFSACPQRRLCSGPALVTWPTSRSHRSSLRSVASSVPISCNIDSALEQLSAYSALQIYWVLRCRYFFLLIGRPPSLEIHALWFIASYSSMYWSCSSLCIHFYYAIIRNCTPTFYPGLIFRLVIS